MITIESADLKKSEELLKFVPGGVQKAAARAINRAADSAKTTASRALRKEYFIDRKAILNTIRIKRASTGGLSASMESRGRLIPLAKWKAAPQANPSAGKPITARIKKSGSAGEGKGAFWATMKSGHMGIFGRLGKKRKPIQERMGPAVPQLLEDDAVSKAVEERMSDVFYQRLDHEVGRILEAGK